MPWSSIIEEEDARAMTAMILAGEPDLYGNIIIETKKVFKDDLFEVQNQIRSFGDSEGMGTFSEITLKTEDVYSINYNNGAICVFYKKTQNSSPTLLFELLYRNGRWCKEAPYFRNDLETSLVRLKASLTEKRVEEVIRRALKPSFENYVLDLEAE